MKKLLVICGPTATGKTSLSIRLAKRFKGELISVDSRQVYKGMDIGTGKDHPPGTKIYLIDVVEPNQDFNVAEYCRLVWQAIEKIWRVGKLPILVGGTGFYIQAVISGIESIGIPPNLQLRKKLEKKSVEALFSELGMLDPFRAAKMNLSDRKNPRRLIRAVEIARKFKTPAFAKASAGKQNLKLDTFFIGLKAPCKILYQKIDNRVDERVKQGAEEEIRNLLKKNYRWGNSALGVTIGYREWQDYFERQRKTRFPSEAEEVIQRWKYAEHAYARRQMTWFKKNQKINWFDITDKKCKDRIIRKVGNWYERN